MLDAVSGFATLVWAPTGIALTALFLWGIRLWPAITLAAFAVNSAVGAPVLVALGIALGNTLEAVVGAALLRWSNFEPRLGRVRDVLALVALGSVVATVISATLGVGSLWTGGIVHGRAFVSTFRA